MPLPQPTLDEDQDAFMQRCMGDSMMIGEYGDESQRYAMCSTQWENMDQKVNTRMITKTFDAKDIQIDEGSREIIAVISTDSVDRDKEIVLPKGLKKKNYNTNPVVLVNHNYESLPVGVARWIKTDGNKVIAKYYITDKTALGRDVFGLLQDGVLKAHSIGFNSLEKSPPSEKEMKSRPDWADAKLVHRSWELLEFSIVAVPANPEALALAVAKGISDETKQFLGKAFEPKPDCWVWTTADTGKLGMSNAGSIAVVKALGLEPQPLPQPTVCRSWRQIQKQLTSLVNDDAEILARLQGKA